ncbi:GNAT family N-acetyltransferase [Arthrobacter bambusae]
MRECEFVVASGQALPLLEGITAWVEEVMVAGQVRRQGVGQALMTEAELWGREQGAAYVSLASRRAGGFYRALAYEDAATSFKKPL